MAATKPKQYTSPQKQDELVREVLAGESSHRVAKRAGVPRYQLDEWLYERKQQAMDRFLSRPAPEAA